MPLDPLRVEGVHQYWLYREGLPPLSAKSIGTGFDYTLNPNLLTDFRLWLLSPDPSTSIR